MILLEKKKFIKESCPKQLKAILRLLCLAAFTFLFTNTFCLKAEAFTDTDEITNYEITVDVNEDASLNIYYHVDWLVLDSDSEGPLEWVKIGIPNSHTIDYKALSSNISSISTMYDSGYCIRIDFKEKYYEGQTVSFDFMIVQDYMYQVNKLTEGETVYSFTPGWFDYIAVDSLTIKWNAEKATAFTPECLMEGDYFTWQAYLPMGDKYTVTVTYPNDAYGFDLTHYDEEDDSDFVYDFIIPLIIMIFSLGSMVIPFIIIIAAAKVIRNYCEGAGFSGTKKKITRTKITYYPSCQGCGAVRKDGEKFCSYCGRSFVKSEEVIKEEDIKQDKSLLNYKKDGEFKYSSDPNTFILVHSVSVPRPVTHSRSSGSSHHSSCAHSSCACACACACAGGGRAGCTYKDFYKTDLKLSQIKRAVNNR